MSPRKLFVYGTLDPKHAPAEVRDATAQLRHVGRAAVRGKLYKLRDYPGVHLGGGDIVHGHLFELPTAENAAENVLASLDRYEGIKPNRPDGSLFRRVLCRPVKPNGSRTLAWIYVYNRPANSDNLLPSGRWMATANL